ncbi:MAG: hypothetical protein Kow0047_00470 [Anaerolineae bacterium]
MKGAQELQKRVSAGQMSRREFLRAAAAMGLSIPWIAGALAACAPPTPSTPPSAAPAAAGEAAEKISVAPGTKLTMKLRAAFMPETNEVLAALVKDWGEKNGVPLEVDIVSMNDLQTIAATAAETGAGPDIIELNMNSPHLFAEKLVDVSDIAEDLGSRYGGWYDIGKEACVVDGKWMAIPRFFAAHAITYRTDIFEQIGYSQVP